MHSRPGSLAGALTPALIAPDAPRSPAMAVESIPAPPPAPPASASAGGPAPGAPPSRASRLLEARWTVPISLTVMLLIAAWLRTRQMNFFYWVDEGISVGIAGHPLSHIPSVLRQDGSPPLYYLVLHVWMSLFGRGEVATHALSLVFGLLIVPVAFWAGSSLWGRRSGLFCAALAAGLPYLNMFAQETRMYAMVTLLGLLVAASFVHAFVHHRRRYLPVFSVALAAIIYSHNWAMFLALACVGAFALCVLEAPADSRRLLLRDGAVGFGFAALLYLPWLPTLLYQARRTGAPWDLPPVFWSLTQGLYALVGGRGAAMVLLLAAGTGVVAVWRPAPLTAHLRLAGRRISLAARLPLELECLFVLGLGTLLIAWVYSKTTPAWAVRYMAVLIGPLLLLAGYGLSRARRLGVVGLVLLAGFWILDPVATSRDSKSNLAPVARALRGHLGSQPLILSTQPEQVPVISYYLPHARYGTPLGPVPDPGVMDWRGALKRLEHSSVGGVLMPMLDQVAPGQRVLLIVPTNLAKLPLYMKLIRRDSTAWEHELNHDRRFRRVMTSRAGGASGVGVEGLLYERRP